MKKVLILGGKPIGSCELVEYAKQRGLYTIVTDYLPKEVSPAKLLADECWSISTADVETLKAKCEEHKIIAVISGVNEFNIERKIELCDKLMFSQYCTKVQWDVCENKKTFKELCAQFNIPIAKTYCKDIVFPVVVKPEDGSGSRGFSICSNPKEFAEGIKNAAKFSTNGRYIVEEYIKSDACIIHYTAIDGEIMFSGMSDKYSKKMVNGASVMALQQFPSKSMQRYLDTINQNVIQMFKSIGIKNGPIWIEAFNDVDKGLFIFNEMGYRFGGSMTNYPVRHFYGIDQMELMLDNALGETTSIKGVYDFVPRTTCYCILPIHIKSGKINIIEGVEKVNKIRGVEKLVFVHFKDEVIENWGSAQNVFCYLHISYNNRKEFRNYIEEVMKSLSVKDEDGNEMLYTLMKLDEICSK